MPLFSQKETNLRHYVMILAGIKRKKKGFDPLKTAFLFGLSFCWDEYTFNLVVFTVKETQSFDKFGCDFRIPV